MKTQQVRIKAVLKCWPALLLVGVLAGCATGKPIDQSSVPKSGEVCPECRTVVLGPFPSSGEWHGEPPAMVAQHQCSGCRGVLSVYSEPQYRHECSGCQQTPFSCTVNRQ